MAKQLSKTHILRHVMTHKIHHIGQCLFGQENSESLLWQRTFSTERYNCFLRKQHPIRGCCWFHTLMLLVTEYVLIYSSNTNPPLSS
ncbi:hypothetical protein [Bacillus atrophaeus]|uniref:hypothetical protein n=1 Tax=Bacillus atrophaeus TaxID=1452 RepID=UPI00398AB634